jgi:phospholipid transport system substrate-binding protein
MILTSMMKILNIKEVIKMKKNIFMTALLTFGLFTASVNAAIDDKKVENFVKQITKEGLEDIINSNISQENKNERFEKLFNGALDLKFIGQFVLGRYWKHASSKQKEEFINVYRKLNVTVWSKRFYEFKGKEFIFHGTSPSSSSNQIFVNSIVPMDQGNPATVVWRVKQTGDEFKIVDIIIENVSLAITARNEYTTFIKNSPDGIDGLIKYLKQKISAQ